MGLIEKLTSWFGFGGGSGASGDRPLQLPRSEHETEQDKLQVERKKLVSDIEKLEETLEEKKEAYFQARDADDDLKVQQLENDIDRLEARIGESRRQLEEKNEQLSFLNEILLLYDARENLDGEYWEQYSEMSRDELRREGIKERDEIEQKLEVVSESRKGLGSVRESHRSTTSRMADGRSETKQKLEEEYRERKQEGQGTAGEDLTGSDPSEVDVDEVIRTNGDERGDERDEESAERDETVDHV